jgi:hypothetical protein
MPGIEQGCPYTTETAQSQHAFCSCSSIGKWVVVTVNHIALTEDYGIFVYHIDSQVASYNLYIFVYHIDSQVAS